MTVSWGIKRLLASPATDLLVWAGWLLLVSASLLLPIYLGASLLSARHCTPQHSIVLPIGMLANFDASSLTATPDPDAPPGPSLLQTFLDPEVHIQLQTHNGSLRNVSVQTFPSHLVDAAASLPEAFLAGYTAADAPRVLTINELQEDGLISLGLSVCKESLKEVLGEEEVGDMEDYLDRLGPEVEQALVAAGIGRNITGMVTLLPSLFPGANLKQEDVDQIQSLVEAAQTADINLKDLTVLGEVAKTGADNLEDAQKVLNKINFDNMPEISRLLDLLGIQLTDLITNPGIFFEFFGDEEKSAILVELQSLLPKFRPADIEVFLTLQGKVEEAQLKYGDPPPAPPVMQKIFKIPMEKMFAVLPKLKVLMADADFKVISSSGSALLDPTNLQALVDKCTNQEFRVEYKDEKKDVCPWGHLFLGLVSLAPLLLPGLMYSLSTFVHYRGDLMQCGVGKPFNIPSAKLDRLSAWLILLPLYLLFMIPWTLLLILYRQVVVWLKLAKEAKGGPRVEPDCDEIGQAASFGLLWGAGQGLPHLGLQILLLGLLAAPLGGLQAFAPRLVMPSLFGMPAHENLQLSAISLASLLTSFGVLIVSHLSAQEAGRLSRDLATPSSSLTYLTTSLTWLVASSVVSVLSTLILTVIAWLEIQSVDQPTESLWLLVPPFLLLTLPLIQTVMYQAVVREGGEQRFAWGAMAAIVPTRFLDVERRRAGGFLLLSQGTWFAMHLLGWICYGVYVVARQGEDVVFRLWLPLLAPILLIPPLLAALHWAASLVPLYSSRHAHPDMASLSRRLDSFPPDWPQISGSAGSASSLAEAGFFYSCRRLKTSEATCYSCGRQVSDWAGKTGGQAHRQISDHCPLYTQDKAGQEMPVEGERRSVSCFAEFFFIAATIVFRLGSFLLLLAVFLPQWHQVSPFLPALYLLPPLYLFCLLLVNVVIHYATLEEASSLPWALLSMIVPRPPSSTPLPAARRLLVVNVAVNTLIHALLWAALTGACSQCSLALSLPRLSVAWPVQTALALIAALAAFPYYKLTLVPAQPTRATPRPRTTYVVSTAL